MNFFKKEIFHDFSVKDKNQQKAKANKKKVINKLRIAFFLLLVLFVLSYYFLNNNGGKFSTFNNKVAYTISLFVIVFITAVILFMHLNYNFKLKHYIKHFQFYDIVQFLILTVFFIVFLQMFIFKTASISGPSMNPTLSDGDEVFIYQAATTYKTNDIVVVDATSYVNNGDNDLQEKEYYIKRIKAKPGDILGVRENAETKLYEITVNDKSLKDINGNVITVIYLSEQYNKLLELEGKIEEGNYFLLGDNTTNSRDSRSFGFIHEKDILGKVNFRIWRKFGRVKWFSGIQDIWLKPKEK